MNLCEALALLKQNDFICESSVKGDFVKGEQGGEDFQNLPADYSYDDAKRYFASAIIGPSKVNDKEKFNDWWDFYCRKSRINQFEKTYAQFEKYRAGAPIKLYRGVIIKNGEEVDLDKAGICWSFSPAVARKWVEGIWDNMVYNHIMNNSELEDCNKVIMTATTSLDNCDLPYSFWLAGRFDRPEWEVRLKDESKVKIISHKEI